MYCTLPFFQVHKGEVQQCILCLENLTSWKELVLHAVEKHQVEGLLPCRLCERSYAEYKILKKHVTQVHQARNLSCDKCPKMFRTEANLRTHALCHQNEYPFQCETCGRKFKWKNSLGRHQKKLHKADRVYKLKERDEGRAKAFATAPVCKSVFCK